jgi:APA family basic amino acid/polyamine antiporter
MKLLSFEKKLGLPGAICVTVGAVIGVGIFIIVRPIGNDSGSWMPLAFSAAALPAIFGTLVAISLGATIPADGGGYYYTKSLLGHYFGAAASSLVVLGAMGAMCTVSVGVAEYVSLYFPAVPKPLVAIGLILLTWVINSFGLMASEKFQIGMVVQLASALIIVIIAALIGGGHPDFSQPLPKGIPGFLGAGALACLAYTGFNIVGELGDEIENPRRNIPLTIVFGLAIIIFIYVGIGWVVAGTLGPKELNESDVPLLTTALFYLPDWMKHYINLAALAGAVTSINAVFLAVPREFSAMAEDDILPRWIMKFNPERGTFANGMAVVAITGCLMMLFNFSEDLAVSVDQWGVVCVAGLLLANVLFSVGVFRLFKLYPDKVASSPLSISRSWLFPAGALSALFSLAFGVLAINEWKINGVLVVVFILTAEFLCFRALAQKKNQQTD